jgi:hypothetical protein
MKVLKILIVFPLILSLYACAVTYHSAEERVSGYRDLQVDKGVYYVEYTEGARTDWATIHRFALKRCAEITKDNGYKFFDVLSKDEKTVYLESDVDEIIVSNMGNLAGDASVSNTYSLEGKKLEGRRVTYRIQLSNE